MPPPFWVVFPLGLAVASASLWWLAGRASPARLRQVVLASFGLRVGLGVLLYVISKYHWPILRSLQVEGGFWNFALDAKLYHDTSIQFAQAWAAGIAPPPMGGSYEYVVLVAAIYWLLDPHPLYAVVLNGWLGALCGWLAYRIGAQLFDRRSSALRGAVLVSFWPSSILWSTQILRDVLTWVLILTVLWLVARLVDPIKSTGHPARAPRPAWRGAALTVALMAGALALTRLRIYLGSILALAAVVTFLPAGCAAVFNRRVGAQLAHVFRLIRHQLARAAQLGSVTAALIVTVLAARGLDTTRWFRPAHPERGHIRLGLQHQSRGDLALAEAEFTRAIDERPDDPTAYLLWAGMLSAAHRPLEARAVCVSGAGASEDAALRRCADWFPDEGKAAVAAPPAPDTSPPTSPVQLRAQTVSDTQVALQWGASTDDTKVATYRIFRNGNLIETTQSLSYEDHELTPGTRYTYAVVAVDAAGNVSQQTPDTTDTLPSVKILNAMLSAALSRGIVAHWLLDDGSGVTAREASGQHPKSQLRNGPSWTHLHWASLRFDGTDDYVDAGRIPPLTANFTVSGWVYRAGALAPGARAVWCSQGRQGQEGWAVLVQEIDGRTVHTFLKNGVADVTSGALSHADRWEHVAWVVDAQARPALYLDGALVFQGQHDMPLRPPMPGIATYLGADQSVAEGTPTALFQGALRDVRLYSRPLDMKEVAQLAGAPVPAVQQVQAPPPPIEAAPAPPRNARPTVHAGSDRTIVSPQTIVLRGSAFDDGRPSGTLTFQWTQLLGPSVPFGTPAAAVTRVQLPEHAQYQFRLTASDGELAASDEVFVTVEAVSLGNLAAQLGKQGRSVISEMGPQWLGGLRSSVVFSGGSSLMDVQSDISDLRTLAAYLPRAILVGFLAPFPWQWFDTSGSTGGMRAFAGAEAVLVYLLLLGVSLRAWRAIRLVGVRRYAWRTVQRLPLGGRVILVFGVILGTCTGLVMANLGTLFRLRLLYWLPLLVLVAAGQCSGAWHRRQFMYWRDRWRAWPRDEDLASVPEPPAEPSLVAVVSREPD